MKFTCNCSLVFILSIIVFGASGQSSGIESIPAGTRFIGGNVSLNASNTTNDNGNTTNEFKNTSISLGPSFGKYFKENLAWGSSLFYNYQQLRNSQQDSRTNNNSMGISLFLTKDFKIVNNLFFELEPQLYFTFGKQTTTSPNNENTYNSFSTGFGLTPGLLFFLSEKFGLRASLGYVGYSYNQFKENDGEDKVTNDNFTLDGGFSNVSFSFRYYLR